MPKKKQPENWLKKAYKNEDFLASPPARIIRILCEMVEPNHRLRRHKIYDTVVFFGSARSIPLSEARKNLKKLKSKKRVPHSQIIKAEQDVKLSLYYEDARKLAAKLTEWFKRPSNIGQHYYICSGGGPGMMEAANRGAKDVKGESVGLNISLPMEQYPNPYQTRELSFDFHYFFIRKFWFFYLAKALVVFPGGYGTLDELFELLTIIQTQKTKKHMPVILYGSEYWNDILDFKAMAKWGVISKSDLKLFHVVDDVDEAFMLLKKELKKYFFKKK